MMMEYSLCLRSSAKPPIPTILTQSKSITTNKISARLPITKLPFTTISFSKPVIMSTATPNNCDSQFLSSSRAQIGLACAAVGVFCFGTALMIGAGKASAAEKRRWSFLGGGSPAAADHQCGGHDEQRRVKAPVMNQKDAVLSLCKIRCYLLASSSSDFDDHKEMKNALDKIKEGKDIEKSLIEMKKEQKLIIDGREGRTEIKMEVVEILIAQGKLKEALDKLDTLKNEFQPTDPRPHLYKAIIYSIGYYYKENPETHWNKFFDTDEIPKLPL